MTYFYLPNLAGKFQRLPMVRIFIQRQGSRFLFDRLERKDYLKVKDNARIRRFAETSTIDEKIEMCSRLGMGAALVIWDKERMKTTKVQDVLIAYLNTPEHELPRMVAKDRVYACVDIDFIKAMQTVSKASNSPTFSLNRKYLEIRKMSATFNSRHLVQKMEADEALAWYSQMILTSFDLPAMLDVFKINMVQFRILLYLHTLPNGATKENIIRKLGRGHITVLLQQMDSLNMIAFSDTDIITIDVYGVMVLENVFSKFP